MLFKYGIPLTKEMHDAESINAQVAVIMGSQSDWGTVIHCCQQLEELRVPFVYGVVSAHRTPERMTKFAQIAAGQGLKVICACAGGSAHLPGMVASETTLPVLGFGPTSQSFGPMDVLGSTVRMPAGVPLAMMGLDKAGAINAALMAVRILGSGNLLIAATLRTFAKQQTGTVPYTITVE
jgi:5-(carboxyamino)imidazole ribonucleotide mutase